MNAQLIGELIRVRYKLLWARARTRNGRIALLIVGYLLFALGMVLVSGGGVSTAIMAARSGKAQMVAQIVLTSVFAEAVLVTAIMGFGMNAMFSDFELRRYPLTALDRGMTRHLVAIVDPFWFLVLALEFGLAVGLYVLGAAALGRSLFAVLLLFVCNYLFARVFGLFVDRLVRHNTGSVVLVVTALGLTIGAGHILFLLKHDPGFAEAASRMLRYTPPFGAAAAIAGSGLESASGFVVISCWLVGLCAALVALERRPIYRRRFETTTIPFESLYDRAAARFGTKDAPLIAHWLRFYVRNNRFRIGALVSLPIVLLLTEKLGKPAGSHNLFLAALGTFPLATFLGVGRFTVNQFGYADGGLRRYFLLPVDPSAVLRTGSYASMLVGAPMAVLAVAGWVVFAPPPFDPRMLFMLIASTITGMLVFWGLGLWVTILVPHRAKYSQMMGNDMSFVGIIVLLGAMLACLFAPRMLVQYGPALVSPDQWWIAPVPVILALIFYAVSLRAAGTLLRRGRERLMAVVEGKG